MSEYDYSNDWSFSDSPGFSFGSMGDDASAWSLPSFSFDAASMNTPVPISPSVFPQTYGAGAPTVTMPGSGVGPQGQPQQPTYSGGTQGAPGAQGWGSLLQPQSLLGLGAGAAGLIGMLAGGGQGQSVTPQMSMAQRNAGTQTNTALNQLNPFVTGQSPLQQMQMSLLQSIASGQGLPPGYAQLVEQAFQPQMGDLYTQAANAGRARGFHDQGATSPPGGAILGPGLAALQGQMAQAKLGLMQSLPALYNQPIATQGNFASQQAQGYNNLMRSYPVGTQQSQPLGPQIGQALGQGLMGLGTAMNQSQQQQSLIDALRRAQQPPQMGGLSYTNTYEG